VGYRYGTFTTRRSFTRLCLPLVVRQHRRLDRLLVHLHVALPCTVVRPAVVDHVCHVVGHVIASRPLLPGDVLALFHAQNFRQALDGDLQKIYTRRFTRSLKLMSQCHRLRLHRDRAKIASVPAAQLGKKYHFATLYYFAPGARYNFNTYFYPKMVKIADIRLSEACSLLKFIKILFLRWGLCSGTRRKSFLRLLVSWGRKHPCHYSPRLDSFGVSILSVFGSSTLAPRHDVTLPRYSLLKVDIYG